MRRILQPLALAIGLAWLAGCATTRPPETVAEPAPNPAFAEAHALAQSGARANAARIDALLASLGDAELSRLATALAANDPLYPYAGRALLRRGLRPPHAFDRGFDFSGRAAADRDGYQPPMRIAVLLPLSGGLSAAAKPVRDGFLSGYYAETRNRPAVTFYDSATGADAAYRKAVADGADYVVGPLDRDQVGSLFSRGALDVPILALNHANGTPPPGSVSFSLAPEDEGIAAAEYAIAQGWRNVLVLTGPDDTLRRTAAAFRERLLARGGRVAANLAVSDAAGLATAAANGPVDAIYFATRSDQARAAMPALMAHPRLSSARRLAVSQIANAPGKGDEATLLDGILFPGESMATHTLPGMPADPAAFTPTAAGAAARLFAFGYDAWLISAYLPRLALAHQGLPGATGTLQLDGFGNILRMPAWSMLRGGVAIPANGR